ncbi:MAG: sodium:proton antiporter [Planctomycetota bacterium]
MDFLFYLALVPALAFFAQWVAWRTRLPGILLLLLLGVALGQFVQLSDFLPQGEGQSSSGPLFAVVALAVAIIMFEGGLSLRIQDLRESGSAVLRMCTLGTMLTFAGSAVAAHHCLGLGWKVSWLLGAILIVTGPTVIGPLLRQVQPSRRVSNTLKWEGIVSDPIGAVFAVLVFDLLFLHASEASAADALLLLLKTSAIGVLSGAAMGFLLASALKRFWIPDHLHGVAAFGSALLVFAGCDHFAHESGLIAVTVYGIWLSNSKDLDIEHIVEFKENLRTILIGCLFIVLASRVDVGQVWEMGFAGLTFVLMLLLVVRPVAAFVSLFGSPLNLNERAFVAGLAPRGIVAAAVSSVFSLRLEQLENVGAAGADQLANVAFLAIIGTVAIYGLAAAPLASWLGLSDSSGNSVLIAGADAWVVAFAKELNSCGCQTVLVDTNYSKVTKANLAGIDAVCANIANEHAMDELAVMGSGKFFAMTPNDQVNGLAVRECRGLFGRSNTYQLAFKADTQRGMSRSGMGRSLFSEGLTHSAIARLFAEGFKFKTTKLSEEFTRDDFENYYPEHHLLAGISSSGELVPVTTDDIVDSRTFQTLIALVRTPE